MQTVKIQTTQNIVIDYQVAGLGERMLAWLIDFAAIVVVDGALWYIFRNMENEVFGISVRVIILSIFYIFYDLLAEIFFNGQSAGKRILKIKVVSLNGSRASMGQYFARWLFRIIDNTMTVGLCSIISIAVTENKQRIGDIVAGTTLVKTTIKTDLDTLVFRPVEADYLPVFTEASQLADKDVALINEVLRNYLDTANEAMLQKLSSKVTAHLGIAMPEQMTNYAFLELIVKDYNSLTSQGMLV